MDESDEGRLARETAELEALEGQSAGTKFKVYARKCGPGWLQSAITLGGGSLASALFLGVIGGVNFMWLQPLAMIMGVIMLSAVAYVVLSTGRRPFRAINEHVSPVLGWTWLVATMMANMVWVLPQFNLAWGAVDKNLIPGLEDSASWVVSAVVLGLATTVVWFYDSGGRGIRLFELLLKIMVGMVVISFFGVVAALAFTEGFDWGRVFAGLVPNPSRLFTPAPGIENLIEATGEASVFWDGVMVERQRRVVIAAFATAVGINMTFLLPYSMLSKGWGRPHRGLAIFDLSTGLVIPFVIATGCLVIAAASQFYGKHDASIIESDNPPGAYVQDLEKRLEWEMGKPLYDGYVENVDRKVAAVKAEPGFEEMGEDEQDAAVMRVRAERLQQLPEADRVMAATIIKRDQWALAKSLEPFIGRKLSQYVFGIGVLAMAISTIIILMLINGFVLCEIFDRPKDAKLHRIGCLIVGVIGFFGPAIWGKAGAWLAIPTSLLGGALLPIAYITFLLLMNSKSLLGDAMPTGARRVRWNVLMGLGAGTATLATSISIWQNRAEVPGLGLEVRVVGIVLAALIIIGVLLFRGSKAGESG
ncbi:MAG: divalent metal cation transporter [Verrucomicrobiota bacterium]